MSHDSRSPRRARARLIVVEDNFTIASSLKFLLETTSFDVVGMASNVPSALDLVATVPFDLALLDIDLHGERASPVADAICQRGRPVIFLSGYGETEVLPPHLRHLPRLEKPVDPSELLAVIDRQTSIKTNES
jgi:DNA-binding response OmpR family regulator